MTVEHYRFLDAAIREAGHPDIADILIPVGGPNGPCAVDWLRLGREPTLDEVQTVVNADVLLRDRLIGWADFDRDSLDRQAAAERWLHDIKFLWGLPIQMDSRIAGRR